MGEIGFQRDVFGEGAVDRRGCEEPHVAAQIVSAGLALAADPAGHTGFQRHPLADPVGVDSSTHRDDPASGLVAKDEGFPHYVFGNPPVLVVMHVRAADPDRPDLNQYFARSG